uniref:Odorant receptor n=1 Tax=Diaphania indica TaxID=390977 RepID=B5MEK4_9NEOP|nr:olfactory receptor [Diaphania indica]
MRTCGLSTPNGITRVQDIKYIRTLRIALQYLTMWPSRGLGETETRSQIVYRYGLMAVGLICLTTGVIYIRNSVGQLSFIRMGHTYITVIMNVISIARLTLTFTENYQVAMGEFFNKIHLFYFKDKSKYAMKIHLLVHKLSHFFTMYTCCLIVLGVVFFNIKPFYNNCMTGCFVSQNLGNVTLEQAVYYKLPFDYTTNYKGYFCVFFFNWFISLIVSTLFFTIDLLMSLLVFHVWGHLKILIHNIETFEDCEETTACIEIDNYWYTVQGNKQAHLKLREIVVYHNLIVEYISLMGSSFGYIIFFYYGFHQACGCLLLLECSQMSAEAIIQYLPLTLTMLQQLIQLSIIFELVGAMTDKLADATYCLPWHKMDARNRRTVHILLRKSQIPLNLKALDMVDVGVRTMTTIIKTSFSYFIMLRTVATES